MTRSALVCGAGGFIGHHLIDRLRREGAHVRGVDLVGPPYSPNAADEFVIGYLRDRELVGFPITLPQRIERDFDGISDGTVLRARPTYSVLDRQISLLRSWQ